MARRTIDEAGVLNEGADDPAPRRRSSSNRVVSLAAAAAMLDRDRNTISKWLEQGCPAVSRGDRTTGTPWELDVAEVVRWLERRSAEAVTTRYGSDDGERIEKEEADRRRAIALMVQDEVDAAERLREVVAISLVSRLVARDYSEVRKALLGLGAKAGMRSVGQTAIKIQQVIDELISEALENLKYDAIVEAQQKV